MTEGAFSEELDRIAAGLKNPSFPKIFAVELCAECDLNCSMCHHDQMQRPKGNLPMPLWRKCPKFGSKLSFRAGCVWASLDISMG